MEIVLSKGSVKFLEKLSAKEAERIRYKSLLLPEPAKTRVDDRPTEASIRGNGGMRKTDRLTQNPIASKTQKRSDS